MFAVLHLVALLNGELHVGEVDIFAGPNYVLTLRSHAARGLHEVRERCEREPELLRHGSGYEFYRLRKAKWL